MLLACSIWPPDYKKVTERTAYSQKGDYRSAASAPTKEQFEQAVLSCRDKDEIIRKVGRPSVTKPEEERRGEVWYYDDRVFDPVAGRKFERVVIEFKKGGGGVERFSYYPILIRLGR